MKKEVCHWCARKMNPIEFHGHLECPHCHRVVKECCEGEVSNEDNEMEGHEKGYD